MRSVLTTAMLTVACTTMASAQQPTPMPAAAQIASAVAPLPEEFRASAKVLGYKAGSAELTELRAGNGAFVCLADNPADERFHAACYHSALEPFMARGRALRATGVKGSGVDSVRFAEIESGKLAFPKTPAALYSITLKPAEVDAQSGAINVPVKPLYVVYIANATSESTGLPKTPAPGMPWIMFPGTPKAHIMFVPTMQ
jgi:hypothetical protein